QGIRSNGHIGVAQRVMAKRGLRHWVIMETVDDAGPFRAIKRLEYDRLFFLWRKSIEGVLAIGHSSFHWVSARGFPSRRVYPFAYFLPAQRVANCDAARGRAFRFIFVGQFIKLKRLDLLIRALRELVGRFDFHLWVVGSGPLEATLRAYAESSLPGRIRWVGRL